MPKAFEGSVPGGIQPARQSRNLMQVFNGVRYYKRKDAPYYARRTPSSRYIHRDVWEFHNGPIPDGWHVHHINGDPADNRVENLQAISPSDHSALHGIANPWVGSAGNVEQLLQAGERAKEWHRSETGREWHRQHGKKSWEGRKWHGKNCAHCGAEYQTPWPNRSKYCCVRCKDQARYAAKTTSL